MNDIPQPFLVILSILGMYPFARKAYKCYAVILMAVLAYSFVSATMVKESEAFPWIHVLVKLFDEVYNFFLITTSVTSIICITFLYPSKLRSIQKDLNMFEEVLGAKCRFPRYKFWILFILYISACSTAITVDSIVWIYAVGFKIYKYYIGRNFQFLQVDMLVLLEMWLILELWSRFKALNGQLRLYMKRTYLSNIEMSNTVSKLNGIAIEWKILKIRKLKRLHNLLCDTLESFNEVFGPVMLLQTISTISLIVQYALVFACNSFKKDNFDISLGVDGLLFVIDTAIELFAIAVVGQMVYQGAHDTIAICYRNINDLEARNQPGHHFIKNELLDLIQQVNIRDPRVSASGFFDVKFSMIGFVVASITSYVIVALQFMVE